MERLDSGKKCHESKKTYARASICKQSNELGLLSKEFAAVCTVIEPFQLLSP